MKAITLTREQLHELVWTEPMRELAKRFHISDVGLKKVCTRNRIPVPAQGHWQRLKAGKQSRRIPLPVMKHPSTISFLPRPAAASADAEPPAPDPAVEAEKEFRPVEVAETLARPHLVTSAMREELNRKKPDDYGAIHCVEPDVIPARVHPGSKGRLLRIADALLKGFERRGFELRPGRRGLRFASGLQVVVDEETYSISIEERMRRETHKPTPDQLSRQRRGLYVYMKRYDYVPTGEFTLKIEFCYNSGIQSSWKDTRHQRIEQRLTEVMVSLRRHAALRKVEHAGPSDALPASSRNRSAAPSCGRGWRPSEKRWRSSKAISRPGTGRNESGRSWMLSSHIPLAGPMPACPPGPIGRAGARTGSIR